MEPNDINLFLQKALEYAAKFDSCCLLNSNQYIDKYGHYEVLIAFGEEKVCEAKSGDAFQILKSFTNAHQEYMFGFFSYDLKDEIEELYQPASTPLNFPDLYFFVPKYLIAIKNNQIQTLKGNADVINEIEKISLSGSKSSARLNIQAKMSRKKYQESVEKIRQHIKRGDIYELNFCQEFFAEKAVINPVDVYIRLNELSPTPFSGFFKIRDKYIISASPERFLSKQGDVLLSQPIKGTAKRGKNEEEDLSIKSDLRNNPKEQTENVMIVDLVRNDLTKSAVKGSVKVDELFGIYTFPQVHQLISTISCRLSPELHFTDAIKNTFPMGSMTGAPKLRAMQLIDKYEQNKRGAYSGSFGYIDPEQNFDFNVVIRSILYNSSKQYLSYQVGSAITYASEPENEYEECLLKASAIREVLTSTP